MECGNSLRVGVRAKNASVSGSACRSKVLRLVLSKHMDLEYFGRTMRSSCAAGGCNVVPIFSGTIVPLEAAHTSRIGWFHVWLGSGLPVVEPYCRGTSAAIITGNAASRLAWPNTSFPLSTGLWEKVSFIQNSPDVRQNSVRQVWKQKGGHPKCISLRVLSVHNAPLKLGIFGCLDSQNAICTWFCERLSGSRLAQEFLYCYTFVVFGYGNFWWEKNAAWHRKVHPSIPLFSLVWGLLTGRKCCPA